LQADLFDDLNKIAHGRIESKELQKWEEQH
jgi:hypothetical protein